MLSQLVITLGRTNWVVTWIGHGIFNEERFVKELDEHDSNNSFILEFYRNWYSNAVIEASSKYMERTAHRNWLP